MPFQLATLDNLAQAEVNISLDVKHYEPRALASALKTLEGKGSGSVTVRSAGLISASDLNDIATSLGKRVTFED